VTSESKNLIASLHNILSKLELTQAPGRDEDSFAELKRILNQRIRDLESCASIPLPVPYVPTRTKATWPMPIVRTLDGLTLALTSEGR
jgi:hypothetical protein